MTASVFLLVVALVATVALALVVASVRRHPAIGLGLFAPMLILLWEVPEPPAILTVSGLSIYPADLITVVLFMAGLLEARQLRTNLRGWIFPWTLFGLAIGVSTLRGVTTFGPGIAVNEARSLLYFFFAMTWIFASRLNQLNLRRFALVLGWALVAVAAYHAVRYGVGGALSSAGEQSRTGRVLVSGQAEALLLCAGTSLLGAFDLQKPQRRSPFSAAVFISVVVVAQHRSVWAAGAVGMAAILIWSGSRRARNSVSVLFVVGVWLALLGWLSGVLGSKFESALNTGTFEWRTSSWLSLLSQAFDKGAVVVLSGEPFGGGYLRQLNTGRWTDVAAHNWYVTIFLRLGVIGLLAIGAMLTIALAKSRSAGAAWIFSLVAVVVFGFAYSVEWYLAPWLGVAMVASLGWKAPTTASPRADLPPVESGFARRWDSRPISAH